MRGLTDFLYQRSCILVLAFKGVQPLIKILHLS